MNKIKEGDIIPDFKLKNQFGEQVIISDFIGKKSLVLFFYPKDDTPGCTREACSFRDHYETFLDAGAEVIGISGQSVESHKNFAEKHNLKYHLLSDKGNKVRKLFGVPANLFGLLHGRVTYVADKSGKIIYIFNSQMQVEKHVEEALKALNESTEL
ncbi:peroxiredoxin [Mariniphaga sp.]|uniref:peroxiredoxin n=1 Tax=Mariniphaga sp. TaxID=1954475 RepID=UPI003567968B